MRKKGDFVVYAALLGVAVFAIALLLPNLGETRPLARGQEFGVSAFSPLALFGSAVIPASCESGFEHFPGECAPPPPPPPSVDLKINGSDGPVTFEALAGYTAAWSTANVTSCNASGSWSGSRPTGGAEGFSGIPRGSYSYALTCTGPGGQSSDSVQVNVIQVPQGTFTPNPASVILPETSTLTWSLQFADSCVIDHGIGAVNPVSGNREVQPQVTTTYTLTCQGRDGQRSFPATVRVFSPSLREILPR